MKHQVIFPAMPDWLPIETQFNTPLVWEIYMAYIPPMEKNGHQTYGIRPFIISSNDVCNRTSTEVNGYVLTTKKPRLPVHVQLLPDDQNGLSYPSTIVMEQPRTIPKKFLLKKMGVVVDEMDRCKIRKAFMEQSGFYDLV